MKAAHPSSHARLCLSHLRPRMESAFCSLPFALIPAPLLSTHWPIGPIDLEMEVCLATFQPLEFAPETGLRGCLLQARRHGRDSRATEGLSECPGLGVWGLILKGEKKKCGGYRRPQHNLSSLRCECICRYKAACLNRSGSWPF